MKSSNLLVVALTCFVLLTGKQVHSQTRKGFEALAEYDFFKARKIFLKALKKEPAIAAYGLALVHIDRLNHFHSLDSAFIRVRQAELGWKLLSPKQQLTYSKKGFTDSAITALKQRVFVEAFQDALKENTPEASAYYLNHFPGSPLESKAMYRRDSLAYEQTVKADSVEVYENYLSSYPESSFRDRIEKRLDRSRFERCSRINTSQGYLSFLNDFPKSAYTGDAEDGLFRLQVMSNTQDELYQFAKTYPTNRNADQAWEMLYMEFTADQRVESFSAFKEKFPEFPYQEKISRDVELAKIRLFPIVQHERWGFADSTGKVRISYQFDEADFFSENLALIEINDKKGYISKTGFRIVPPKFKEAEPFRNGLAIVETDSAVGIINTRGEWVVKPEYYSISGPWEGFYRVELNERYGFLNRHGKLIVPIIYEELEAFSEGMAAFAKDGLAGFMDTTGNEVIPAQFDEAAQFQNGLAKVSLEEKFGLINSSGKFIIPPKYNRISTLIDGLYLVSGDKKCAYLNASGKIIISPAEICAGPVFGVEGFREGLARIERKGKNGFIDKKGKVVIPPSFDQTGYFAQGLCPFRKKKKWGYLSKSGKVVIEPSFEAAFPFQNGLARVKKAGKFGLIDKSGKLVLPTEYDEIQELDDVYILTQNDKKSLISSSLEVFIPLKAEDIKRSSEPSIYQVILEGRLAWFNLRTKSLFWEESPEF